MSCLTCMLSNKSKILTTLRVIIILISLLHLAIGIYGIVDYAEKNDTSEKGVTGLVISIVALVAGITGILAAAKSFIVLILIFAVIMVVLMGLNIAEAVRIEKSWETSLSKFFSLKHNNETLYAIAIAMAVIQGLAFLASLLLSYLVYVIRNPTGAIKRALGQ